MKDLCSILHRKFNRLPSRPPNLFLINASRRRVVFSISSLKQIIKLVEKIVEMASIQVVEMASIDNLT